MDRIDTIEQLDPICAPIYKSPKYISLFLNSDENTSIPQIKKQVQSILVEFGPTIGWRNVAKAVAPLEAHLMKKAIDSETVSYELIQSKVERKLEAWERTWERAD